MKRIAILVIAATSQPVYLHYIRSYWSELIRRTHSKKPNIDVFLLFEHNTDVREFPELADSIIQDHGCDYDQLCDPAYHTSMIPGILSKTIDALDQLMGRYDVYFRTNLSSIINLPKLEAFVEAKADLCYSGALVWTDALRQDLLQHDRVGPDKSIRSLSELEHYPGNTFISGSGYFLSAEEARSLVERRAQLRYDIVDDVSVGLMFSRHELLPGFTRIMTPEQSIDEIVALIQRGDAGHIRLRRFPLEQAQSLWQELPGCNIW